MGMPVEEMLDSMSYHEYIGWLKFLKARPIGWREDLRTYYIMSSMAPMKKSASEMFPTVKAVMASEEANKVKIEEGALPSGVFLAKMLQAKGGTGDFNIGQFVEEVNNGSVQREHDGGEL